MDADTESYVLHWLDQFLPHMSIIHISHAPPLLIDITLLIFNLFLLVDLCQLFLTLSGFR